MPAKKTKKFDFESSLKKLETIVNSIEQGKLGLEESLKLFSEGVELTKQCQQAIKNAEQKVKILVGDDLEDFELDTVDDEDEKDDDDEQWDEDE